MGKYKVGHQRIMIYCILVSLHIVDVLYAADKKVVLAQMTQQRSRIEKQESAVSRCYKAFFLIICNRQRVSEYDHVLNSNPLHQGYDHDTPVTDSAEYDDLEQYRQKVAVQAALRASRKPLAIKGDFGADPDWVQQCENKGPNKLSKHFKRDLSEPS